MRFLVALLLLPLLTATSPRTDATIAANGEVADRELYKLSSEVRIKRMHLMRPDLISYPNLPDYYA